VVTAHHRTPSSNGPRVCTLYKNFQITCKNMLTKAMLCEQLSQKLHPDTVRVLARWEPLLLSFSLASSCYGGNTITTPSFVCECWIADNELQESRTGCCLLLTQIHPRATCIHSIAWGKDGSKCLLQQYTPWEVLCRLYDQHEHECSWHTEALVQAPSQDWHLCLLFYPRDPPTAILQISSKCHKHLCNGDLQAKSRQQEESTT
jgi:hypothetical protein